MRRILHYLNLADDSQVSDNTLYSTIAALALIVLWLSLSGCAPHPVRITGSGVDTPAPGGYVPWCKKNPTSPMCGVRRDVLFRIHAQVNLAEYETDQSKYGVPEKWADIMTAAGQTGDCEDTMIGKAHALLKAGWPVELLRFAFYHTPEGPHYALLVDLPSPEGTGTYMLSNGLPFPLVKDDIPSDWMPIKYQIAGTDKWEIA